MPSTSASLNRPWVNARSSASNSSRESSAVLLPQRRFDLIQPFVEAGEGVRVRLSRANGGRSRPRSRCAESTHPAGQIVEEAGVVAGLGRRALQIHEERHDGVGQQAPQVVEQRRLAHAALAVEQQGRAAPVQQELFDAGADVGATYEDFLLLGQRHADDVRAIDLLAPFDVLGDLPAIECYSLTPEGGNGQKTNTLTRSAHCWSSRISLSKPFSTELNANRRL